MSIDLILPHEGVLRRVGAAADALGVRVWAVGGVVRDALMRRETTDVDFVTLGPGTAEALARAVASEFDGLVAHVYPAFGTAAVRIPSGDAGDEEGFVEVPAFAGQVVDRIGSGDAFLSVTAPCVARDVPLEVAGFIGNVAGAQAVATVGNRTPIQRGPLVRHIEHLLK